MFHTMSCCEMLYDTVPCCFILYDAACSACCCVVLMNLPYNIKWANFGLHYSRENVGQDRPVNAGARDHS